MFSSHMLSWIRKVVIETERWVDHFYRLVTGYPTVLRSEITPEVFIGGQYHRRAIRKFQALGITAIVNMRSSSRYTQVDLQPLRTLHLPTKDQTAPTLEQLRTGVRFISQEIDKGGKVYIHCRFGEGRGPTMGVAYLLSQGLTIDDAITLVRKKRSFIQITKSQVAQLEKFAKSIKTTI